MTTFKDVSWSNNMKKAYRLACHDAAIRRQDELFNRNMMIKQKIHGVIICLLSIVGAWWLSEYYGQTEYFLLAVGIVAYGLYLICTKDNLEKELREQMKHEEEVYREYRKER